MPQELSTALKTAKDIEKQLTVAENRLAYVQDECKRLAATREKIQSEIAQKSSDYDLYIGKRDADSKKIRQDALDERKQLDDEKTQFQGILQQFQKQKESFESVAQGFENEKRRNEAQMNNIREFVIAVQRAVSLLGL